MAGLLTWLLTWLLTPVDQGQATKVGGICILHLYIKIWGAVLKTNLALKFPYAQEDVLATTLSSVVPVAAGQRMPGQEAEEATQAHCGLSKAEKAERRKAKKAQQREARAQAAAQTAEVHQLFLRAPISHELYLCIVKASPCGDYQAGKS